MTDMKIEMTEDTLLTLSLFGWVVLDHDGSEAVIADDQYSCRVLVTALNKAALNAEQRKEAAEDLWSAHDDWCDQWDGDQL